VRVKGGAETEQHDRMGITAHPNRVASGSPRPHRRGERGVARDDGDARA
jgi:hypothetical protein